MEAHLQRKALAAQRPPYLCICCLNDLPQSLPKHTTSEQKLEAEFLQGRVGYKGSSDSVCKQKMADKTGIKVAVVEGDCVT